MTWTPWQFFLVAIAGGMNRQQQEAVAYFREENRILQKKLCYESTILASSRSGDRPFDWRNSCVQA